ncbi:MAG: hypothetical protein HYT78_09075 [Deltaproteobacteria bacterium]|nr:hypothetical protein [Deltaproteobacteria bacterium]
MDDLDRRAKILVEVLTDRNKWAIWANNPRRVANLLGICSEGEAALVASFIPAIEAVLSRFSPSQSEVVNPRRQAMPEEERGQERWKEDAARAAREALDLLRIGLQQKKKSDKLSALAKAWEDTGHYKDLLIRLYENDRVSADKKRKAREIREKLERIQELLRTIRRKIENDENATQEVDQVTTLLREVLSDLVLF